VVGTRHPTAYGLRAGKELCLPLAQAGWTLVSGLARGIDTLAHECALSAGGRTVAVVGTGLDRVYPGENALLARRVAENGCVISEFPLGVGPAAWNFPRRNRIISALAMGTLVVEAGTDSGALITAEFAVEQGREIFAVPGSIQSPASRGTHYLLREGAHLATCPDDVLSVLGGLSQAAPARRVDTGAGTEVAESKSAPPTPSLPALPLPLRKAAKAPRVEAPEPHRRLLDLLSTKAQTLEALAAKAPGFGAAAPRSLLPALLDLEMRGKVRRLPGALYRLP
jgi:DNA processing protein